MKLKLVVVSMLLAVIGAFGADLQSLQGDITFAAVGDSGRSYQRTDRGDFASENFCAEITVTLNGGGGPGCAFFGLGAGAANPENFNEPGQKPVVYLRLAPSDFAGGQIMASVEGKESGLGSEPVGDGTHRVKMIWDAKNRRALFEVDGESSVTADARRVDFGDNGHIFTGGANGVKFSDFSVKPLTDAEVKSASIVADAAGTPTAQTWLPLKPVAKDLMRPLVCRYDRSKLVASQEFAGDVLQTTTGRWMCDVTKLNVSGEPDAQDVVVTFKLADGVAKSAGVAVTFDFADWSVNNYVLIPASVYNGNRNRIVDREYNAGLEPKDHYKKDLQLTTADLPHLSLEPDQPSKLEVLACNATTPAICVFDRNAKRGFIILAEQAGRTATGDFIRKVNREILDNGFSVEESADRKRATLVVSAPGVRERKPEFIGFSDSPDRGMTFKAGDSVTLRLRVFTFATPDIPGLLEKFMAVRKELTGPNHPRDLYPLSEVTRLMTRRIDERFYDGSNGKFYCPENAAWMAFGWIGGWIDTFPMLALGDEKHRERVSQTFDYGLKAQEPSGYFHYAIDEKGNDTFRDPSPDMNLARTSGDILFWMMKHFQLLQAQGHGGDIKPEWKTAMKKLADALVATWKKDGQWGKLINVKTGEVGEYNTTGGATVIGGLALAADFFHQSEYFRVARAAAEFYYQRDFVKLGLTTGGCADIFQNADSESAAGFMTSLMALYETTGDKEWLEKSRNLANLAATWTVSYDYELPTNTPLARLGAKLAGVVWASTQNKHGAPGICCSSGDALFKIYRATGDQLYAELMRDIVHAHAEGIQPNGRITERLTYCDADSRGARGDGGTTGWNESNGALMALELPGIYLRTDQDELFAFDSVQAKVLSRDKSGVTLAITNPTKFNAKVAIFAENAKQAARPSGYTAFLKWPKVEVKSGATITVQIKSDGKVQL